jgi:hypothetical protein
VNDRTFTANENGVVTVDADDLCVIDKSISEFDLLMESFSKSQREMFYKVLLNSTRFGVSELASMMNVNRSIARELLYKAYQRGIVERYDTQWRIPKERVIEISAWVKAHYRSEPVSVPDSIPAPIPAPVSAITSAPIIETRKPVPKRRK